MKLNLKKPTLITQQLLYALKTWVKYFTLFQSKSSHAYNLSQSDILPEYYTEIIQSSFLQI